MPFLRIIICGSARQPCLVFDKCQILARESCDRVCLSRSLRIYTIRIGVSQPWNPNPRSASKFAGLLPGLFGKIGPEGCGVAKPAATSNAVTTVVVCHQPERLRAWYGLEPSANNRVMAA